MVTATRRLITVGGVAAALLLSSAVAARADFGDPVNCTANPTNPACVIQIGTPGGPGGGGSTSACKDRKGRALPCYIEGKGWFGEGGCYFQRATGTDLALAEALGGKLDPPAYWYTGACGDPLTNWWPAGVTVLRGYGTDPGITLLAQEAIRHLNLPGPQIRLNPDSSPKDPNLPPAPQVVFVPTWLWIDSAVCAPRSATASLAGVSVTAVGTPTKVTWSTGDGDTVTCGKGTAWTPGANPKAASPDCGHVYSDPSRTVSGGKYTVTATITWQVTWSGGGATGTEPALTSTASVQVAVVESAAVNTRW
jgi:hypothetical protein